jgi:hypothetical protein
MKIKLKENSLARVREWAAEMTRRRDEVLETLRDETVIIESVFLDSTPEGDFLIYFMKAESFERAREAAQQKSAHAIDEYHREFKRETWEDGTRLELLIDLDRITEV